MAPPPPRVCEVHVEMSSPAQCGDETDEVSEHVQFVKIVSDMLVVICAPFTNIAPPLFAAEQQLNVQFVI